MTEENMLEVLKELDEKDILSTVKRVRVNNARLNLLEDVAKGKVGWSAKLIDDWIGEICELNHKLIDGLFEPALVAPTHWRPHD